MQNIYGQLEFAFCSCSYYEKPKNDNEKLLNYQFLVKSGNKTAYTKMYSLGKTVALKMINQQAQKNKHIKSLSKQEKEIKAHNAISYIIEQYIKRKDFVIKKSFTGYIYKRVLFECYYKRKVDNIVDFVSYL